MYRDLVASLRYSIEIIGSITVGRVGLILLTLFIMIGLLADLLAPYDPSQPVSEPYQPPSPLYIFGTDGLGRDIFSRSLYGIRTSIIIGVLTGLLTTMIGLMVGLISGYRGGLADNISTALIDIMLTIPPLPLIMVLVAILDRSFTTVILVIALTSWPQVARLVRSMVLSIREYQYVEAARALGASSSRIMFRHILPAVIPLAISQLIVSISYAIVIEAGLAFLGLRNPLELSLGILLNEAQTGVGTGSAFVAGAWWWILFPGMLISMIVMSFVFIGYAVDVAINPRLKRY